MVLMKKILISHRHEESEVAQVIYEALKKWHFSDSDIFFSSEPKSSDPMSGDDIHLNLALAAQQAKLVILIYTFPDGDWDWPMHETGLAIEPQTFFNEENPSTRLVVFECFGISPKIFSRQLHVKITQNDILKFVSSILTEDNFIGDENAPRPELKNETKILEDFAIELFHKIQTAIDKVKPNNPDVITQCRWDYFTIEIEATTANLIQGSIDNKDKLKIIMDNSLVIGRYGLGLNHFGYDLRGDVNREFSEDRTIASKNIKLRDLCNRWAEMSNYEENDGEYPDWAIGILEEIERTIDLKYADPPRYLMKSINEHKEDWFYPVVNTVRRISNGSLEFDIYLFRIPSHLPWLAKEYKN